MLTNPHPKDVPTPGTSEYYLKWQKGLDRCDKVMDLKRRLSWIIQEAQGNHNLVAVSNATIDMGIQISL